MATVAKAKEKIKIPAVQYRALEVLITNGGLEKTVPTDGMNLAAVSELRKAGLIEVGDERPQGRGMTILSAKVLKPLDAFESGPTRNVLPRDAAAPMKGAEPITIPAKAAKFIRANWRRYYEATTDEANKNWHADKASSTKTADLSAIARLRDPKERAKAYRKLADEEEQGFEQYLAGEFGSEMVLLLGIPD